MRPDAINWSEKKNYRGHTFLPARRLHHTLWMWVVTLAVTQAIATAAAYWTLDGPLRQAIALERFVPERQITVAEGVIATAIGGVVVAITLLPLARRAFKRWTASLHALHEAIQCLARGAAPKPLPIGSESEVAFLSAAFNDMAGQLLASQRALVEANNDLERRVTQRTRELRDAVHRAETLAKSDMLTRLGNRRALMSHLQDLYDASLHKRADLVCLAIDLDGFKAVNDTLGHAAGDDLLKLAGDVFRGACRASDFAARLGGDEFVLLMPTCGVDAAEAIGNTILNTFRDRCERQFEGAALLLVPSMSIGVASRLHNGAQSAEQLLHFADVALYRGKKAGKSCVTVCEDKSVERVSEPPANHRAAVA